MITGRPGTGGVDGLLGGRYALRDVVGIGSSAVVHRADDLRTGRVVAVKLFSTAGTPVDLRRRRREIDALTRLRHPGLVRLLDGDPTGPRPFVVTELVEGPTLAQALAEGPLRPERVRRLGAVVAAALAVVHAGGFVHRDVKPANVLLDGAGHPRLADFGIAWTVDGATATTTGTVVGTAAYMSPEQVGGQDVGPATDVYALGLVLVEALTGRREYPGPALESAVARLSRAPRVPVGLPATLRSTIEGMTRTDPRERPGAAEVAVLLSGADAATVGLRTAGRSRARRGLLAAAACVVVPLLVLGIGASGGAPPTVPSAAVPPTGSVVVPPVGASAGPEATAAPVATGGGSDVPTAPSRSAPAETVAAVTETAETVDRVDDEPAADTPPADEENETADPGPGRSEEAGSTSDGPGNSEFGQSRGGGPPGRADD